MTQREVGRRFVRNKSLAEYCDCSVMTVWRWQRDPELGFPQPTIINGMSYTDINAVDRWMRSRVATKSQRVA